MVSGLHALWRRPRRSSLVVVLLASGIGLSTALFSVLEGVSLRGLPFPGGDRIVFVATYRGADAPAPVADVLALREAAEAVREGEADGPFSEVAAFRTFNTVITRPGVGSKGLTATYVTGDLFHMLGVEPALGRGFTPEDEDPSRPAVAVISHGVWQTQFRGSPEVLGATVVVNREPMTVVGVMPEGFGFPVRQEAWAALRWEGRPWSGVPAMVVAKLRPGWSPERAEQALAPLAARLEAESPLPEARQPHVQPYVKTLLPPEIDRSLRLMLWAALGLLLVASADAASLRIADGLARRHELAVRRALGAGTARLLCLQLTEAGLLAAAATVLGLGIAWALVELASTALLRGSPLVRLFWIDVHLDLPSCLFAAGTATVALLMSGLIPAVVSLRRRDLKPGAASAGRSTATPGAARIAGALVAVQVALAFGLVAGSGLLAKSALALLAREPAFDPDHLVRMVVTGYQAERDTSEERRAFWDGFFQRLAEDPEIAGATLASGTPWEGGLRSAVRRDPADPAELENLPRAGLLHVLSGFFDTLRLPILSGRALVPADAPSPAAGSDLDATATAQVELPAVVSASFARHHLGSSPLGAVFELTPLWSRKPVRLRAVGVAADLGTGRSDRPGSEDVVFAPISRAERIGGILVVRGRTGAADLVRRVDRAIAAVDPRVATLDAETYEADRAQETWIERRLAQILSIFAASALALSAFGLFAAVDLSLEGRVRELAVRSALGALPWQLGALVLRSGTAQLAAGIGLGFGTLWLAVRLVDPFLYHVDPWTPEMIGSVVALVAGVLLAAVVAPTLRAAHTDPAEALRAE